MAKTSVRMHRSDIIAARPFRGLESPNPEGRPCEVGSLCTAGGLRSKGRLSERASMRCILARYAFTLQGLFFCFLNACTTTLNLPASVQCKCMPDCIQNGLDNLGRSS